MKVNSKDNGNKTGLNTQRIFVFPLIIADLHHIQSLHLTVFIDFEEYWICFVQVDE